MAGITGVSMVSYYLKSKSLGQEQKLTAVTKNMLEALGVDTRNIKTEQEGRLRLQQAKIEAAKKSNTQIGTNVKTDTLTEKIYQLASKLNVSISKNDTTDDKINRIKKKLNEMIAKAGNDKSKRSKLSRYIIDFADIEQMRKSQIDLNVTMKATSNIQRGLLGL